MKYVVCIYIYSAYEILRDRPIESSVKHLKTSELHESRGGSKDYLYKGKDSATEDIIHGTREVKDKGKAY